MVNFKKKYLKYKKKYLKYKNKLLRLNGLKGGATSNIEPGSDFWEEFIELLIEDIEISEIGFNTEILNNYIHEIFIVLDTIYNTDLNNLNDYLNQYQDLDENLVNARAWYELVETLRVEHNLTDGELQYFACEHGFFNEENIQNLIQDIQQEDIQQEDIQQEDIQQEDIQVGNITVQHLILGFNQPEKEEKVNKYGLLPYESAPAAGGMKHN